VPIDYKSKEYREKMSKSCTGKRHKMSDGFISHIKNLALSKVGKPWSDARRMAQKTNPKRSIFLSGKEYHPDWNKIRKEIYERDNWECQECGEKCHNTAKRKIQCHHIDFDITNNISSNLITLCASCHCKTNFHKTDWIEYYKKKVSRKTKR
jgi:hypothetical protein